MVVRFRPLDRQTVYFAVAVKDKEPAVARPVWCFKVDRRYIGHASDRRSDIDGLERAVQNRLPGCRGKRYKFHIGKHRLLHHVLIVRANAETYVERPREARFGGRPKDLQLPIASGCEGIEIVAPLFNTKRSRRGNIGLDVLEIGARRTPGIAARPGRPRAGRHPRLPHLCPGFA